MNTWFGKYAAIAISGATGFFFYQTICWSCLDASAWASWVGAIGTVGALLGTIWIATDERRQRQRAEHDLAVITAGRILITIFKLRAQVVVMRVTFDECRATGGQTNFAMHADRLEGLGRIQTDDLLRLVSIPNRLAAKLAHANAVLDHIVEGTRRAGRLQTQGKSTSEFTDALLAHLKLADDSLGLGVQECRRLIHTPDAHSD